MGLDGLLQGLIYAHEMLLSCKPEPLKRYFPTPGKEPNRECLRHNEKQWGQREKERGRWGREEMKRDERPNSGRILAASGFSSV